MFGSYQAEKTRQAAAVLFKALNRSTLGRMQLLKLLYIADRESIRESGSPITGDRPVAMDFGPVLSATYNCIKGEGEAAGAWGASFRNLNSRLLRLTHDPGTRLLSSFEVQKLQDVANLYGHLTGPQLSEITHEFEEWLRNAPHPGSAHPISDRERLEAVGLGAHADEILSEAVEYARVSAVIATATEE